ncbi:ArsR/SmtB family transcription factor [Candidatus Nanohalobium constans]|uniref:ArsR family transcriptional regulator n=1 Tax=Candidatus Nanohalobium constans TaxID=2565781 RepID=A0A5Q0UH41_9ARCH|nr:helix-turn-helix domain-containing protein [Candidatus Nanohalobium constans]QGA80530.1 ArsR family transcriptional regulator [Candidatus Nanohalobium constans]
MVDFVRDENLIEAGELTEKELEALNSEIRVEVLRNLSEKPSYPSALSDSFDCSKQKMYYHFEKLEDAGLIEVERKEEKSGGEATYYRPTQKGFVLDLGGKGESFPMPEHSEEVSSFLKPLIKDSELNGSIVVGSAEQHGPDQVQALDGHLAGEIAFKLGNYSRTENPVVKLDTEVVGEEDWEENMLILGGVLTNVVAKEFNESFPAFFPSEEFPYRKLETPEDSYSDGGIGVIAKTSNPEDREKKIFLVAGVQNKGTKAAVKAFQDLEEVVEDYSAGQFYAVVRGLDLNSDGEIDSYKVIETSEQ